MRALGAIGSRVGQATRFGITYLYQQSRPQYQSALMVLLWSVLFFVLMAPLHVLLSMFVGFSFVQYWGLMLQFIGSVAAGELARGHLTALLGAVPGWRVWVTMAVSACVVSGALLMPIFLMWGLPPVTEGFTLFGGIALGYVLILWVLRFEQRKLTAPRGKP
jgi:hypothetical protein